VWDHSANLIPLAMKATLGRSGPLKVFGNDYPTPDGTGIRDYIHVDDLADAHIKALCYLEEGGASAALNVGTGVGTSVMEVLTATERLAGRPVPYEIAPRRPGDPVASFADPTLVQSTLGWRATKNLDDIVESAWAWHSTHLDGYAGH
jgi:UDP-glucose 4-epimerase